MTKKVTSEEVLASIIKLINEYREDIKPKTDKAEKAIEMLDRVHNWLGELIRDGKCDDHCSQCIGASDLADDIWDVLHPENNKAINSCMDTRTRNCDRLTMDKITAAKKIVDAVDVHGGKKFRTGEWTNEETMRKWYCCETGCQKCPFKALKYGDTYGVCRGAVYQEALKILKDNDIEIPDVPPTLEHFTNRAGELVIR